MNSVINQKIEELKVYFKEKNITQGQIASELGVSQAYVNGLLTGKKPFGKKKAQEFGEKFGISPSWLLTGEGEMLNKTASTTGSHSPIVTGDGNVFTSTSSGDSAALIAEKDKRIEELARQVESLTADKEKLWELVMNNNKPNNPSNH